MKVSELLDAPITWTRGAGAKDAWGDSCDPRESFAVSWCLAGACQRISIDDQYYALYRTISNAIVRLFPERVSAYAGATPGELIVRFNDCLDTTFADVRAVLKLAGV